MGSDAGPSAGVATGSAAAPIGSGAGPSAIPRSSGNASTGGLTSTGGASARAPAEITSTNRASEARADGTATPASRSATLAAAAR